MNSIFVLSLILIIIYFLINKPNNQENFVQVKSNSHSPSSNARTIKPIQVTSQYKPPQNQSQRDDWVSNPFNSPNISPKLINPSDDLPGTAKRNFEDTPNKKNIPNKKNTSVSTLYSDEPKEESLNSILSNQLNPKSLRPKSGHLIRPIEIDSSPSSNTRAEKPYMTMPTPQANSEYLDYATVPMPNETDSEAGIFSNQETNSMEYPQEMGTYPQEMGTYPQEMGTYPQEMETNSQEMGTYSSLPETSNKPRNQSETSNKPRNQSEASNKPKNQSETSNKPRNQSETPNTSYNTDIAKKLIKKAAQLSAISTEGDDPVLSVQKANYAIGYFDALQDIMSESEIKKLVNIDLDKFTKELKNMQNFNITNVKMKCPSLASDKKYLLDIAKNL
jgi:hypothetical protein